MNCYHNSTPVYVLVLEVMRNVASLVVVSLCGAECVQYYYNYLFLIVSLRSQKPLRARKFPFVVC